jgi:8-hydroxy-5-deazaflavin:NADPH oxidoreductase
MGTGTVGRTIAGKLTELGHEVRIGSRTAGEDAVEFADAAAFGETLVNATSGTHSVDVLRSAGAENLAGKVLLDISNPLDFSQGFPPTLSVKDTDSLAEQIQRAFPDVRVVKALNTMTAAVMVDPGRVGGGDHSTFVSGDDPDAKRTVVDLLGSMGHTDVIDLGDLSTARGAEMYLPLWIRLMGALGTPFFNIKVVR